MTPSCALPPPSGPWHESVGARLPSLGRSQHVRMHGRIGDVGADGGTHHVWGMHEGQTVGVACMPPTNLDVSLIEMLVLPAV